MLTSPWSPAPRDLAMIQEAREQQPGIRAVMLAPDLTPDEIIQAMRSEVYACFTTPVASDELRTAILNALDADQWKNGIEVVKKAATDDKIKFELYEDDKKEHRWRLKAANGQIVAASSEGYKAKADAEKAVQQVKDGAPKAEVVEIDK